MKLENFLNLIDCPNTKRSYQIHIGEFLAWKRSKTIDLDLAVDYVALLRSRGLAPSTIIAKRAAISSYLSVLVAQGKLRQNPFLALKFVLRGHQKYQVRPTKIIDPREVRKILDQFDLSSKKQVRDHAALSMLFGAGLRRMEALCLKLKDVLVGGQNSLLIRKSKAGRTQTRALPDWAAESVSRLVTQRIKEGANEESWLFVPYRADGSVKSNRVHERTFARMFQRYCFGAAPHAARAAFATKALMDGASYESVSYALGHSGIGQVQAYDKRLRSVDFSPAKTIEY